MLEVKDLKKIYKSKKGTDVHALDGVTLRFPETGMVFLLGKSGSGKSTLLNVCGGLDSPTAGEILVKGRSSKDFSQSDFDSYRNTFIGFIFQEYNILNEFSVEDNIALALELQGKPKDKAAIAKLLEDVDLQGYAKRKPNTLSGGQKQRIAIARALIKAPEIIMADEPTGALDSNTGKQVLETLKKLSQTKLVIVVSHDRDFAEQYGDRIIELKDGKVISDISKTHEQQQQISANVHAVGDVLCVKRGSQLTEEDFAQIKAFLKRTDSPAIIAGGEKDVENFKQVSRIGEDGAKEVFRDTSEPAAKTYTKEESRFIRSKLPIRHAMKIGTSSLKTKPFRLFFTILLCVIAFTLFGLLSTLQFYDSESSFLQTLRDTDAPVMQLEKDYKTVGISYLRGEKSHEYEGYMSAKFTEAERKQYSTQLNADAFGAVNSYSSFNMRQSNSPYWQNNIVGFAFLPEESSFRGQINGQYPKTKDEIVISSYAADMLIACNAYDSDGNALELTDRNGLIGKKLSLNGTVYQVTGILNSGEIPGEYDALKETTEVNYNLQSQYYSYLNDGLHLLAFVNRERLEMLSTQNYMHKETLDNYTAVVTTLKSKGEYNFPDWSNANYSKASDLSDSVKQMYFTAGKTALGENEVLLSHRVFAEYVTNAYNEKSQEIEEKIHSMDQYAGEFDHIREQYSSVFELANEVMLGGIHTENKDKGEWELIPFTKQELEKKVQELVDCVIRDQINMTMGLKLFDRDNNSAYGEVTELTVAGVYVESGEQYYNKLCVSDSVFDRLWEEQKQTVDYYTITESNYKEPADAVYTKLYLPFAYSPAAADAYWEIYSNEEWGADESRIRLTGMFINNLQMVDELVKSLSKVFLYVALVFAVFAILLFSNFISVSISQKKKEIGILRAVGARSADVFKIFFSESFAIALICVALSAVASLVICSVLNRTLAAEVGASLLVFGPVSFAVLAAVAFVTGVIATYLPVHNAAKKKPVDSIRAL